MTMSKPYPSCSYKTLVSQEELHSQIDRWKILDCRADLKDFDRGLQLFKSGHIPNAIYIDLNRDLADPPGEGGRHPLPDPEVLAKKLASLGIWDNDQIVVYDDSGGSFAARAWWLLRWLGHANVAVLNGGLTNWSGPLETSSSPPTTGDFTRRESLTLSINADELLDVASTRSLIDARTHERFKGIEEPIDPIAGHIPGAVCRPFQENLTESGFFKSPTELRERFAGLQQPSICYCGSGVTAAPNILALVIAGSPEPILYAGSWSEWIRDPNRPREP